MLRNRLGCLLLVFVLSWGVGLTPLGAETVARCGQGWLERIDGYAVLHLKGSPYELGYQHGALLQEHVRQNMDYLLKVKAETALVELGPVKLKPRQLLETILQVQEKFVPQKYLEEIRGLADGAGLPLADARVGNFIPEAFHCSGFAVMNSATKDGTLYHGRVLDYAVDWKLQEHAVLIVAEPTGGIPFVNVSYAGFIGSVTGMNAEHVSIGEMGGSGLGHWEGVPMALLVREVLQTAKDLDQAIAVFRDRPRTCQYFYVLADAKTNRAVGMEASWNRFELIQAGQSHPLLPAAVPDAVLLSAGKRYEELVRRARAGHGGFTAENAVHLMDRPVAMGSNLHNVLFEPKSTRLWVANASVDCKPAAEQPYRAFQLTELLQRRPDASSPQLAVTATAAQEQSVAPGINKSYEQTDVAASIGRFEKEGRDVYDHRQEVTAACALKPGMVVADIGAGTGLFTRLFSPLVGAQGRVYSVDITEKFVKHIERTAAEQGLRNVVGVVCDDKSVKLPPDSIDLAFTSDVYHHFEFPRPTLESIHRALRPGGQFIVIDYERIPGKTSEATMKHVRAGKEVVVGEVTAAGFKFLDEKSVGLRETYFIRFEKL